MSGAPVLLAERALVRVAGGAAPSFLQNILTADLEGLAAGEGRAAALLTPQGKILADGIVVATEDGCLIDCARPLAEALAKRLAMYRLRAKLEIEVAEDLAVVWCPGETALEEAISTYADPRHGGLGRRAIVPAGEAPKEAGDAAYRRLAITLGIAEAGVDFGPDQVFPHEANHDLLHGVSFTKGCFVGQEVVSRMEHRGTARKRFLPCRIEGEAPEPGTQLTAGNKPLGVLGSHQDDLALALIRLDRLAAAGAAGDAVMAGTARLTPLRPDWADFDLPPAHEAAG